MSTKTKFSGLMALLLVFAVLVSACARAESGNSSSQEPSSSQPASQQPSASEPNAPAENVEINFMHWRSEDKAVLDKMIAAFEEANPNIKVVQSIFPSTEYRTIAQQKLVDGSSADVFTIYPGSQFEALHKADLMEDLTGKPFVERWIPHLSKSGEKDGKQYALPYHLVYNMPIINVEIFEKLGIEYPKTWDEYLALGKKLKDAGYIPMAYPGSDIGAGQIMNPMLMNENTDEDMFRKLITGETKLTDDWYVGYLKKWDQMNKAGFFQPNSLGTKFDAAITLFVTEKAAMLGTGSFHAALILNQNPDMKLDLLPPVTVDSPEKMVWEGVHNTTFMLAINKNSKKKEAAEKFIEWLAKPDMASMYANETGQLGVVKDLTYTSKNLQFKTDFTQKKTRFLPRSTIPNIEIETAIQNSLGAVIGGTAPEKVAADAQKIVEQNK